MIPQGAFIFDGNDPQSIARQRQLAAMILQGMGPRYAPRGVGDGIGQGLSAIADGIVARALNQRADAAEKAGMAGAADLTDEFGNYLTNRNTFPSAPGGDDTASASSTDVPSQRVAQAFGDNTASQDGGDVEGYIRRAAAARGIDPDIAVRVARSEGGLKNPYRHGEGPAPRSQLASFGAKEHSFGPFQLYISGNGAGLGDRALAAGIDPRKNWKGGIDYALDEVSKKGWGQWYGARGQGITGMMGVGRRPASVAANEAMATGQPAPPAPVQVASLDPSAGLPDIAPIPTPSPGPANVMMGAGKGDRLANVGVVAPDPSSQFIPQAGQTVAGDPKTQRILGTMMNPQPMGGAPMPMQGMPQPPQQIAQARQQGGPDLSNLSVMAGGNAGVLPPGQSPPMDYRMLMRVMSNPFIPEAMKSFAKNQLEQIAKSQDPAYQLDMEYRRAQLDALRNPKTTPTDDMREYQFAKSQGYQGSFQQYMLDMKRAGSNSTVINNGTNSNKFVEKSDEAAAKRMDDIVTVGQSAPQTMADMQQLIDLGAQIGTGKGAQIKAFLGPYAQAMGLDIANLGEAQAYEAITSRLAPQMRAVGSGSSSDRDVSMFLQSLPNLRNTQGGNEIIANTMKAVAQNKINAADIARKAQRGEISWQDADQQISQLSNPYDLFKQFQKQAKEGKGGPAPGTVEDGYRFRGGNPADPRSWEKE